MHSIHQQDSEWVRRMQCGEMAAFDALFERHRRGILAYVRGMLGDPAQAEDIVQETFVKFAQSIASINPQKSVSGWLYRVARNRTIDLMRHRKFEVVPGDDALQKEMERGVSEAATDPAARTAGKEAAAILLSALNRLPEKDRDVLLLRFYGDLHFKDIARILRRPLGTVLWQSRQALEKLKLEMGETP